MKLKFTLLLYLTFLAAALPAAQAAEEPMQTVAQVDLSKYAGQWYEVARKPLYFQRSCAYKVTANYALNEQGNVQVINRCYSAEGKLLQSVGEAFVQNAPENTKLKVSFLPKALRWLPFGRGDYWVLKADANYQTVLVGEPDRKYLWVLSRSPQPNQALVQSYLAYAQQLGYDLSDVIYTPNK